MTISDRLTSQSIYLRIPKTYQREPIISRLVSDYHLTVNIEAAVLGEEAQGDGWFKLTLSGTEAQLQSATVYLSEHNLETWSDHDLDGEDW